METERRLIELKNITPIGDIEHPIKMLTEDVETLQTEKDEKIATPYINNVSNNPSIKHPSIFQLIFFEASIKDITLTTIAVMASIISGYSMPAFALLFGDAINIIKLDNDKIDRLSKIGEVCIKFGFTASFVFVSGSLMIWLWMYLGNISIKRIKVAYFRAIMNQEQMWFDQNNNYQFSTKIQTQCNLIENGV